MTDLSTRFSLPFLQSGQAQKELYHNEALALLDFAIHPIAQALDINAPPASPLVGQCWIVGSAPTGAWAGQAGALAGWTGGGWRFVAAVDGMMVWLAAEGTWARRAGDAWIIGDLPVRNISIGGNQVVGPRQPSIREPSGGAAIDVESRMAIASILGAIRAHGLIGT